MLGDLAPSAPSGVPVRTELRFQIAWGWVQVISNANDDAPDDELLATFDSAGRPSGLKPRRLVHRDGDIHWVAFLWAGHLGEDHRARLLLQLRGRPDDPYRGQLDCPAGGHVAASESHREAALRECREETGIELDAGALLYLGARYLENPTGVCRRVIDHFYLSRRPIRLEEVTSGAETTGFVEVDLEEFGELVGGLRERITGRARMAADADEPHAIEIDLCYLAAYPEVVLENFRRSVAAITTYLETGRVDRSIWSR